MCGIFGIVANRTRIPDGVLQRGTDSLSHRGPDDAGTIVLRAGAAHSIDVGLGNRRLAILDLSPLGHQPMHDSATGNWIVYNGEIYNFREVRAELERSGATFVSHSDTEVVLKAYGCWGEQCLSRFRGMFAFALWDAAAQSLFLARDPMGIKPLYYAQSGAYFLFASEVRSILGTGLLPRRIDPAGLTNYVTFGSAYDPLTLIDGIRSLPAGHTLTWKDGSLHQLAYWDLIGDSARQRSSHTREVDAVDIQPLLEESVQSQLVSDVPVGIFLSGGIDSSALVSIVSRAGVKPNTFSIVFRESDFSEAEHSRSVAAKFHTDHHEITVSDGDALAAIPDALHAMDLPTMDGVNTFFVSRETRRAGVKVALSGLGGDEVYAGYSSFRTVPRMERFSRMWAHAPKALGRGFAATLRAITPSNDQNRKLALLASGNGRAVHPYFITRMVFTPEQRSTLLRTDDRSISDLAAASQRELLDRALALDPVNRVSYLESRCYMLNTLLRDADFMSMSQGLEVRVPLIDHQLAKTVLSIPGKLKLNGTPKKLLVDALEGSLPEEIVHRPKRGFTLPFEHWMRQQLRNEIEPALDARKIDAGPLAGLLNGSGVWQVWQDFLGGAVSWTRPWSLYVLQRWCEQHL